jgi:hypothetical protein
VQFRDKHISGQKWIQNLRHHHSQGRHVSPVGNYEKMVCSKEGGDKCRMCCTCRGKYMHTQMYITCGYCDELVSLHFKPMYHHRKLNWEENKMYKVPLSEIWERLQTKIETSTKHNVTTIVMTLRGFTMVCRIQCRSTWIQQPDGEF